jgi:hypothetical protein
MVFKKFRDKVTKLASEGAQKAGEMASDGAKKVGEVASEGSQKVSSMASIGTQTFGEIAERSKKKDIALPEEMPDKKKLQKYDEEPNREFSNASEIFEYYANLFPGFQLHSKESKTSWYVAGEIPEAKLQNAIISFLGDIDENELLILYYDSTQLGKGDDGVAITNKRIIIKYAMKDPVSISFSEPYEIGYIHEEKLGDKKVSKQGNDLEKSMERKEVEFFVSKEGKEELYFLNFGATNTFPIVYFLNCLKEINLEGQFTNLFRKRADHYIGHLPKTLKDYPEAIKEAYLQTLTPIINADGEVDGSESAELYNQFISLECTKETRMNVMDALASTGEPTTNAMVYIEGLKKSIDKLDQKSADIIKLGLYKDMVGMAKADFMELDKTEMAIINSLGVELEISEEIMSNLNQLVEYDIKLSKGEISEDEYVKGAKKLVAGLGGLGVSLGALSLTGTVAGLGMTGITSGLAALGGGAGSAGWIGLAAVPGLNTAVIGVGILVLAGVGTYKGVEYLSGAKEREIQNKREAMIQKVLENHQKSISILQSDMNTLTENLTAAMTDTAKNSLLIEKLNKQMGLFKQALMASKKQHVAMEKEAKVLA